MFCGNCGIKISDESRFCPGCGSSVGVQASNASPLHEKVETQASIPTSQPPPSMPPLQSTASHGPALWNPNAAALWSILFTPAFGTFLHMKNWRALGNTKKATTAMCWFIASIILYAIYFFSSNPMPAGIFGLLFWWYLISARPQANLIKQQFGTAYPRKSWLIPLLFAFVALIGLSIAGFFFIPSSDEQIDQVEATAQVSNPSQTNISETSPVTENSSAESPAISEIEGVPAGADPERWAAADAQAKAILAEGNSATQLKYTSFDDREFNAKSTPDGFVFESSTEIIYLGNNCDVFNKERGTGEWFWTKNGLYIEFKDSGILFPSQKSPFEDLRCQDLS